MTRQEMEDTLEQKRIIILAERITKELTDKIRDIIFRLNLLSTEKITLLIDSGGGEIWPALSLFDFIKCSKALVVGIVNGECKSSAMIILQACHQRMASKHSKLLLHFVSTTTEFKANDSHKDIRMIMRLNEKRNQEAQRTVEDIFIQRTKLSRNQIRSLMHDGEKYNDTLSTDEALSFALIDKIAEDFEIF